MYKQVVGAIVLSCACTTAMAEYGFEPIVALAPEAAAASAVAVGDVTGDGRDDVLVLAVGRHPFFRNRVILYAQTPAGFAPPVAIDYHPESTEYYAGGSAIGLADLDADADLDIVVVHGGYPSAALTVLRNDGGGFTAGTFPAPDSLSTIKFMDIDGDGHLDLIGQDNYGGIAMLPGDGAAGFGAATRLPYLVYPSNSSFQLADMDGDGRKDLVYHASDNILVRRNDGTGFSPRRARCSRSTPAAITPDMRSRISTVTTAPTWWSRPSPGQLTRSSSVRRAATADSAARGR